LVKKRLLLVLCANRIKKDRAGGSLAAASEGMIPVVVFKKRGKLGKVGIPSLEA